MSNLKLGEQMRSIHPSITGDEVYYSMTHCSMNGEYSGFCISCGSQQAAPLKSENVKCADCKENKVFGAEIVFPYVNTF